MLVWSPDSLAFRVQYKVKKSCTLHAEIKLEIRVASTLVASYPGSSPAEKQGLNVGMRLSLGMRLTQ